MTITQVLAVAVIALELARIAYHVGRVERRLKQVANALELIALNAGARRDVNRIVGALHGDAVARITDREDLDR